MKLTVKTLKGGKFTVDAEPSSTVAQVKGLIEGVKSELPASTMKLIHSGKVLKDDATIESCNIKPNDFLVVMITKAKKAAAPAKEEKKEEATEAAASAAPPAPAPSTSTPAPAASTETSASSAAAETPASAAPASSADEFPAEVVGNLTSMGFPEAEVRACLRAAQGNPDVAVEFLMNGIPPGLPPPASSGGGGGGGGGSSTTSMSTDGALAALRSHPQFDALRRLVQTNPQSLQAVLTQIGQQQPELLQAINSNQAAFLEMMNEPVSDTPTPASASAPSALTGGGGGGGAGAGGTNPLAAAGGGGGNAANMLAGMADPTQMAQILQNLSPNELNEMAAMMGLTPEQLQATARMIGQMPPEQFQEYMMQAMQAGGGMGFPGMAAMMGGGGGGGAGGVGGPGGGLGVVRLTEEEMAAVDRLVDMGFDRTDAAQAFLACDKNEALAANLLMDSAGDNWGQGSGGGGGDAPGGGGGDGAGDDGDDMYD